MLNGWAAIVHAFIIHFCSLFSIISNFFLDYLPTIQSCHSYFQRLFSISSHLRAINCYCWISLPVTLCTRLFLHLHLQHSCCLSVAILILRSFIRLIQAGWSYQTARNICSVYHSGNAPCWRHSMDPMNRMNETYNLSKLMRVTSQDKMGSKRLRDWGRVELVTRVKTA